MPWTKKEKFLSRARLQQRLLLEPDGSGIEMHIVADLEKMLDWDGRNGQKPLCCVLSTLQLCGRCSCHSGHTSQSDPSDNLPVRSRAGLFRASAFRPDFAEELFSAVSRAAKLLLQGDDELRALAS